MGVIEIFYFGQAAGLASLAVASGFVLLHDQSPSGWM